MKSLVCKCLLLVFIIKVNVIYSNCRTVGNTSNNLMISDDITTESSSGTEGNETSTENVINNNTVVNETTTGETTGSYTTSNSGKYADNYFTVNTKYI